MKKTFLFLAAGVIAATAQGQQATPSVVFNQSQAQVNNSKALKAGPSTNLSANKGGATNRLTSACTACGRWYDYVDSVVPLNPSVLYPIGFTTFDIWQDTTGTFGYTGGTAYANTDFTSIGLGFHPWASFWNSEPSFTAGEMAISTSDPYTIDSIMIGGSYSRNLAKPSVVDTLVVQFVYGDGTATSNLPVGINYSGTGASDLLSDYGLGTSDAIVFASLLFDSSGNPADNRAGASGGTLAIPYPVAVPVTTPKVLKFPLTIADTANVNNTIGNMLTVYPRAGHTDPYLNGSYTTAGGVAVPAGNLSAVSVSFKSGDPALSGMYPADTIRTSNGTAITGQRFGAWAPLIAYEEDATGTSEAFPPYPNQPEGTDWTAGYFNEEGARDGGNDQAYVPQWGWTAGGGASFLQYPYIWFHTTCPTCGTVGTPSLGAATVEATNMIKVYPNPANDEVNISYTLVNSAEVTATLTNTLGQVVTSQKAPNGTSGNITFNTNTLAEGVYLYTVEANGNRTTGRIVVAH